MAEWIANWNILSHRYQQLEDTMNRVRIGLTDPEASALQRAELLILAANELCAVLREYQRLGVFTAIAIQAQQANDQHRALVLNDLRKVLKMEEMVLQRIGIDAGLIKEILGELEHAVAGQNAITVATPLDAVAWQDRLSKATERICCYPKAEILVLDNSFGRYVRRAFKARKIIRAAIAGAANIAAATQLPEPVTIKSVSTFLAYVAVWVLSDPDNDSST